MLRLTGRGGGEQKRLTGKGIKEAEGARKNNRTTDERKEKYDQLNQRRQNHTKFDSHPSGGKRKGGKEPIQKGEETAPAGQSEGDTRREKYTCKQGDHEPQNGEIMSKRQTGLFPVVEAEYFSR